jgi:hypothetical protein
LTATLIGYPGDLTANEVYELACYYGVADQVSIYEDLSPEEVNVHYNRARVNVIWSRREGVNKVMIEGMFAGTPCIIREGFNYGYRYPYINQHTGCFANEHDLPETLLSMVANAASLQPREWVMEHMTCQKATEILEKEISSVALSRGEQWTRGMAVKTKSLSAMHYWDSNDRFRFEQDYAFLKDCRLAAGHPKVNGSTARQLLSRPS